MACIAPPSVVSGQMIESQRAQGCSQGPTALPTTLLPGSPPISILLIRVDNKTQFSHVAINKGDSVKIAMLKIIMDQSTHLVLLPAHWKESGTNA